MKLLFDTCIWIDHLRHALLTPLFPQLRGRHFIWMDSVTVGELMAGCPDRSQRRVVEGLIRPYQSTGRTITPNHRDFVRAGDALSKLRARGETLRNPGAALLDALQAADAVRIGALLVTHNLADFSRLAAYIPCRVESFENFRRRLWSAPSSS